MFGVRLLPWEYGVRNVLRRPSRSILTLLALATVVFLVFLVVGFVRGLEASLAVSGDAKVVLIHSIGASESIEISSVPARTAELLGASLGGIQSRYGVRYVSPEIFLGSQVSFEGIAAESFGLVRGVTPTAALVHPQVQLTEGKWPSPGEVLVGRLAPAKLGQSSEALAIGQSVTFEGRSWRICGRFAALGAAFESEFWCRLEDLQQATKRQDLSLVAVSTVDEAGIADVDEFCKERLDLELQATRETAYYEALRRHYRPVRAVAWLVAGLIGAAGVFAGLNTMYGAVVGRVRELAMLQTIGFLRRAIALSLIQEATILSAAGSLAAATLAIVFVNGTAVRFTMGAFTLRVDAPAVAIGCVTGLLIGMIGAIPPAARAMRLSIVDGLKAN